MEDSLNGLLEKYVYLSKLMMWRNAKERLSNPMRDVFHGQGRVLFLLKLKPEVSVKELGHFLRIRPSSLNELLEKLENKGYISKRQSEKDKRVVIVGLTDEGNNVAHTEFLPSDDVFACLTEEEKAYFEGIIDKVLASLEPKEGEEPVFDFEKMAKLRGMHHGFPPLGGIHHGFPSMPGMRHRFMFHDHGAACKKSKKGETRDDNNGGEDK